MRIGSLIAIYFVVWWVVLFAVLPFGVRTQADAGEVVAGTTASAPVRPMLLKKAIATTIVAAVLVGVFWIAVEIYGLSIWSIADLVDLRQ
jgi:predicted secreted protein